MAVTAPPIRTAGRQRDERTDGLLINAVLDLVSSGRTLSGISFVAIAEHAGVSRNSLYRRWKTKDALFLDVMASLNRPLPDLSNESVLDDVVELLATIVERSIDARASQMLRALNAEATKFPQPPPSLLRRGGRAATARSCSKCSGGASHKA